MVEIARFVGNVVLIILGIASKPASNLVVRTFVLLYTVFIIFSSELPLL